MKLFCQSCGQKSKKYDVNCSNCGAKLNIPNIPTYTGASVATMILIFLPTGLVALLYSLKVNKKIKEGDIGGAIKSSKKAVLWCWISLGVAILILAIRLATINN